MKLCLFCQSEGPFSTVEHIIPESLGNDDLLLRGEVCDRCQAYFGKEVENFALNKTPLAFWRTYLGIKNKAGRNPPVDLSQPKTQKGVFPARHPSHDNVGFSYHEDGSISVDIHDPSVIQGIVDGSRTQLKFVFTPKVLHMLGRFFCKVGMELLCLYDPELARSSSLSAACRYARFGDFDGLWPIFHFTMGDLPSLKQLKRDGEGVLEKVLCYSYSSFEVDGRHLIFHFCMGVDNWIVCLNDPYPTPVIRKAFPDADINLIWYSKEEWTR